MHNSPYRTFRGQKSITTCVFEAIRDNPGITFQELYAIFDGQWSEKSVKRAAENLCHRRHQIVNRGEIPRQARWYVVETTDHYLRIADEILEEMIGMTVGEKRGYLADRLAELANEDA